MRALRLGILGLIVVLMACGGGPTPAPTFEPQTLEPPPTVEPPAPTVAAQPTLTEQPTAAVVTATAEPSLPTVEPTLAPDAAMTAIPPAQTEVPVAPVEPETNLVGTYSAILPAADAPGRIVTLDLGIDGVATLTTQFIGKGVPSVESGTWVSDGSEAIVTFTTIDGQPEDNRITWTLQGNSLVSTAYDTTQYGSDGLPLARIGSGELIPASYEGVSFSFDSSLAQSAQGKSLPAVPVTVAPALGGGAPEGIQFTFNGETLPDYFDPRLMQVYVYPVEGLKALDPGIAEGVESIQKIVEDGQVPADQPIFVFPLVPASQVFQAQARILDFVNGSGVRFITSYSQDASPVTNEKIFYTFQGVSLDGKWYVSVFWPVTTPALPADASQAQDLVPNDVTAEQFEAYLDNVVMTLDALPSAGFNPNLALLDNMAQSINAAPLFPTPTIPALETETAAASAPTTPTPEPQATTEAETQLTPPAVPPAGTLISSEYQGVSLSFDSQLARSAQGVTIPPVPVNNQAPALGGGAPENIAFGFNDVLPTVDASPFQPGVRIYPVEDLKALDPAVAREVVALKTLLSVDLPAVDEPIPVFPPFNAQQVINPQVKHIKFKNGDGVRFVTEYAQNPAPVTNDGLFYTFQGLSNDGKYYVSMFWPVRSDVLPNTIQDAGIQDLTEWAQQYTEHMKETEAKLDALTPDAFAPNLTLLDQLAESIQVPQ